MFFLVLKYIHVLRLFQMCILQISHLSLNAGIMNAISILQMLKNKNLVCMLKKYLGRGTVCQVLTQKHFLKKTWL